jgi:signal transduction protein with GAF and PtsI domain
MSLVMKATQSISKDYINKNPLKIGEGVAGKVVQQNKPIAVYSIMDDDNYKNKEVAKKENLHSMLCSLKGQGQSDRSA